jgi:hypothetical protein
LCEVLFWICSFLWVHIWVYCVMFSWSASISSVPYWCGKVSLLAGLFLLLWHFTGDFMGIFRTTHEIGIFWTLDLTGVESKFQKVKQLFLAYTASKSHASDLNSCLNSESMLFTSVSHCVCPNVTQLYNPLDLKEKHQKSIGNDPSVKTSQQ